MELQIRPVQKNGKRIWRYSYWGIDGKVKFISHKNKSVLESLAKEKVTEVGVFKTSSSQVFLSEANIAFMQHQKYKQLENKIQPSTVGEYSSFYINHILPFFKNVDIRTIDKHKVFEFIDYLKNKILKAQIKSSTARKIFNTLSLIIQHQVDTDKLAKNICKDKDYLVTIVTPKKITKALDFHEWSLERVSNIVSGISNKMIQIICMILLETACRPSEARALDRKSLLFKGNIPMIRFDKAVKAKKKLGDTKTVNGNRTLVISTALKDVLTDYVNSLPSKQSILFLNSKGKYICIEAIISHLERVLAKNKVQLPIDRKSYFFRHFTATYWAYTGKYTNAIDLAKALGDKDINFVQDTYIKPYQSNGDEVQNIDYQNKHYNWG